jgi:hypothetical protein
MEGIKRRALNEKENEKQIGKNLWRYRTVQTAGPCKTDRCDVANIRCRASGKEVQYNRLERLGDYSV